MRKTPPLCPTVVPRPPTCGGKEAGGNLGENYEHRQPVEVRQPPTHGKPSDFGVVPRNGERDRSVAQNTKIVAVVRILPNVLAVKDKVPPKGLLQAGVEFIPPARCQQCWYAGNKRGDDAEASGA